MNFETPLIKGTIQRRYKRFLADITIKDIGEITAHVPNTGSMTNCWAEDWPVLISQSDNPKRKLKYTLEMTHNGKTWIGVNTSRTNKVIKQFLLDKEIPGFEDYLNIKPEQKWEQSRLDFFLSDSSSGQKDCFIEVKNVTLNKENKALFPDSVSTRGQKHLKDLMLVKSKGFRAAMIYLVQREDVDSFSPAWLIDPVYSALLQEAHIKGVEVYPIQCSLSPQSITLKKILPFELKQ